MRPHVLCNWHLLLLPGAAGMARHNLRQGYAPHRDAAAKLYVYSFTCVWPTSVGLMWDGCKHQGLAAGPAVKPNDPGLRHLRGSLVANNNEKTTQRADPLGNGTSQHLASVKRLAKARALQVESSPCLGTRRLPWCPTSQPWCTQQCRRGRWP